MMTDAEIIERFRNHSFRVGWLECELKDALSALRLFESELQGYVLHHDRIEAIERTLRLAREADKVGSLP